MKTIAKHTLVSPFNIGGARAVVCSHGWQNAMGVHGHRIENDVPEVWNMCIACQRLAYKIYEARPQKPKKPKYEYKRRSEWKNPYQASKGQNESLCKCCSKVKPKSFQGLKSYGLAIYVDNKNRPWRGTTCPDCIVTNRRKPSHKSDYQHSCKICSKPFLGHNVAKYCGTNCRKKAESIQGKAQRLKTYKPPKPRPFAKLKTCKIHYHNCSTCNKNFIARRNYQKYCSSKCGTRASNLIHKEARKKAKRLREKRTKCRMAKHYRSQVLEIYANRGTKEIDHIIPLNHPDVCGLHVPWNLEPITKRRNWNKSNKWDGTMNNLTFRPWAKK